MKDENSTNFENQMENQESNQIPVIEPKEGFRDKAEHGLALVRGLGIKAAKVAVPMLIGSAVTVVTLYFLGKDSKSVINATGDMVKITGANTHAITDTAAEVVKDFTE